VPGVPRRSDRHKVKPKNLRVPDDLWAAFAQKVSDEGRTMTEVLIRLIRRYLDEG
jgi:hypothetical protein